MSESYIQKRVLEVIASTIKVPAEGLAPDWSCAQHGIDSLDLVEIVIALEDEFFDGRECLDPRCKWNGETQLAAMIAAVEAERSRSAS